MSSIKTFENVLIFDRGQCHDHGCHDTKHSGKSAREDLLLANNSDDGRGVLVTMDRSGCADIGQRLRQVYQHIVQEDLPPSIFRAAAELERQLETCEGD